MHIHRTLVRIALVFALALQVAPVWAADSPGTPGVVNINTADAAQLAYLPRVGPALAERILTFRKENGELKKASDLILVRGIGEKTFRQLEPFVVVEGKTTLTRKLRGADVERALAKGDGDEEKPRAASGEEKRQERD